MFYASFILMETVRPFLEARSPGLGRGRVGGSEELQGQLRLVCLPSAREMP